MKQHEARSPGVFLRKLAYDYIRHGYVYYAIRKIPPEKDLNAIDEKLIAAYSVTGCRMRRARQRAKGVRVVAYVRYRRTFALLATDGAHEAFDRVVYRDVRTCPIQTHGYTIGWRGESPHITVARRRIVRVEEYAARIALKRPEQVQSFLQAVYRLRFPGIVEQHRKHITAINERRRKAGLSRLPFEFGYRVPMRRSEEHKTTA